MNKKNIIILSLISFLILTLFSCQNLSDSVLHKEDQVTCTLTFTGAFPREILNSINKKNNRSAYPDLTGYFDDCEYIITILDKDNNPLEGAEADEIDEETLSFTVNGIRKNVPFKVHVDLKKKNTSASIYKNLVVMSGTSEEYTLSDSNPVLNIKLPIAPAQTENGKGCVTLYIWRNGGIHNANNLYWYYSIDNLPFGSGFKGEEFQMGSAGCEIELSSGVHQLTLQLRYKNSDNTERLLYSLKETVYVFDNMATDLWTGNSPYVVNSSDYDSTTNSTISAVITDAMIISQQQKYFYVDSSRSKIAGTANYTSETGTYVNPYTKVSDAIKKASQADADDLTIYVKSSNTTEEWTSRNDISKNLTIEVYEAIPGDKLGNYTIKNTGDVSAFDVDENKSLVASGFTFEGKGTSNQNHTGLLCNLAANNAKVKLTDCKIQNLKASAVGGAIYSAGGCSSISIELVNCTFENCSSTSNGGAINVGSGKCIIDNCTFIDCLSDSRGGAIYNNGMELLLKNTVSIASSTNTYSESANNIYLNNNKTITIDDSLSKADGKDFVAYVTPYGTLNEGDLKVILTEKRPGLILAKYDLFKTTNGTSFFVTPDGGITNSSLLALVNPPESDSININHSAELKKIASWVNSGVNDFSGKTITLSKDITIQNDYIPIGTESHPFKGSFDGNNKTVTFDNVTPSEDYFGIFGSAYGFTYGDPVIQNVNTSGTILLTTKIECVGAVVGEFKEGKIQNCTNSAKIIENVSTGSKNIGGIAGFMSSTSPYSYIDNCSNTAEINTKADKVSGIVGLIQIGKINNCTNSGNITGMSYVGGILGSNTESSGNAALNNNRNSGTITAENDYAGGIAGMVANIDNSSNSGNVSGNSYVGGISGKSVYITDCFSQKGSINGKTTNSTYIGGIVGYIDAYDDIDFGSITGKVSYIYSDCSLPRGADSSTGILVGGCFSSTFGNNYCYYKNNQRICGTNYAPNTSQYITPPSQQTNLNTIVNGINNSGKDSYYKNWQVVSGYIEFVD